MDKVDTISADILVLCSHVLVHVDHLLLSKGAQGVSITSNPYFMANKIRHGFYYALGSLYGTINGWDEALLPSIPFKEDWKRSILYYQKYGKAIRLDAYCAETAFYTEPEGMQADGTRTLEAQAKACCELLRNIPTWLRSIRHARIILNQVSGQGKEVAKMIKMFIPTRARWDNQLTWSWAQKLFDVWLVVREDERTEYKRIHPAKEILALPKDKENIAQIRDFIIQQASGVFIIADDNIRLLASKRAIPPDTKLTAFVDEVERTSEIYPLLGVTSTFIDGFTKKGTAPEIRPGNVRNLFCINKKILPEKACCDFGQEGGTFVDCRLNLSTALHGRRPMTFRRWIHRKKFYDKGGRTSMGRTAETIHLYCLYPKYVWVRPVKLPTGESSFYPVLLLDKAYKHSTRAKGSTK